MGDHLAAADGELRDDSGRAQPPTVLGHQVSGEGGLACASPLVVLPTGRQMEEWHGQRERTGPKPARHAKPGRSLGRLPRVAAAALLAARGGWARGESGAVIALDR